MRYFLLIVKMSNSDSKTKTTKNKKAFPVGCVLPACAYRMRFNIHQMSALLFGALGFLSEQV